MGAIKYWVWFSSQWGLSSRSKAEIIRHFGDAEKAFYAPLAEYETVPGLSRQELSRLEKRSLSDAMRIMEDCAAQGIDILTIQDAAYPRQLKQISDAPVLLYVRGRLPDLDSRPGIAVIGTRRASPYGLKMARSIAYETAHCGAVLVSTLSEGIDRSAAKGCMLAGGSCIGVLGTPHGTDNPLYRDIVKNGALVTEYPPGTKPQKFFFRERNRIASGLSHGVVVVEAPQKSGALLFAQVSLEQGREVFAVPGNADAANSVGSNSLIKQGAKPVTCGWDVLENFEYLFPDVIKRPVEPFTVPEADEGETPAKNSDCSKRQDTAIKAVDNEKSAGYIGLREQLSQLNEEQLMIISVVEKEESHIDDIIEKTGLSAAKVLAQLTILEIKGYVKRSAGRRVSLNIRSK